MRYRIALCGFSEFESRAMQFSFRHPSGFSESTYDVVDALSDADFAVVDADSTRAVSGVLQSGRISQAVFVGTAAPVGAASHLRRPIDPTRILRTLDAMSARTAPTGTAVAHDTSLPNRGGLPSRVNDVVVLPQAPIEAAAMVPPSVANSPTPQSAAKVAARAKARRARLVDIDVGDDIEPLRDVLVLDADAVSSASLSTLLERFGFEAHVVDTRAEVAARLAARPYAAVFLDMALNDAGVALLQTVRALPAPWPHARPAVLLVSARQDPADRVLAALAGLSGPLVKPLGRGDVARALESRGVVLPADARRQ